jgi:hypothetical protein
LSFCKLAIKTLSKKKRMFILRPTPLKTALNKLTKDQSKVIQCKLAEEEFYISSLDGLYGKGATVALTVYSKEYVDNENLVQSTNFKALLDDVLKDRPAKVQEAEVLVATETNLEKIKIAEPEHVPPLGFAQVKAK